MSAVIRTVRRLDERTETKTVAGYVIETGVPMPGRTRAKSAIQTAMEALQPGESLVHANRATEARKRFRRDAVMSARQFAARPIGGKQWRIWRMK